jgi:allantoinase
VSAAYLRGKQITEGQKVLAEPGSGSFVRPLPRQIIAGDAA